MIWHLSRAFIYVFRLGSFLASQKGYISELCRCCFWADSTRGSWLPARRAPPAPICNLSELMADQAGVVRAQQASRVDPQRIPNPHAQPQAAPGEPPPELGRPRHTQLTAGPKCTHSGTSVLAPVLPGPVWVTPGGPAQGGTAGPHPPGGGEPSRAGSLPRDPHEGRW